MQPPDCGAKSDMAPRLRPTDNSPRECYLAPTMQQYLLRRLLFSIPVLFLTLLILFLVVNAMPGDVVDSVVAGSNLSAEEKAQNKHDVGLDKPTYERFFVWLGN